MAKVDVLLLEDVRNLGRSGELAEVRLGYARNWLLPQELAVIADYGVLEAYKRRRSKIEANSAKKRADAESIRAKLQDNLDNNKSVMLKAKAGESGKLFGSISKETLAEEISRQFDVVITKAQIATKELIRNLGEYEIKLTILPEVEATVKVRVEAN